MSLELRPLREEAGLFVGGIWWRWFLDQGAGLVLGYGPGLTNGTNIHQQQPEHPDASPWSGGGYRVYRNQADTLSLVAGGLCLLGREQRRQWNQLSEAEQELRLQSTSDFYLIPPHPRMLDITFDFIAWSRSSQGFDIV